MFKNEGQKIFAPGLKKLRKILHFFQKKLIYYSSECFYGQVKCSFHNPVRKVSTKTQKICVQCSKMLEKSYFVLEKFFHENDPMDKWIAVSKSQLKNFGQKAGIFSFYDKKWYKTNFLRLLVGQRNAIDG